MFLAERINFHKHYYLCYFLLFLYYIYDFIFRAYRMPHVSESLDICSSVLIGLVLCNLLLTEDNVRFWRTKRPESYYYRKRRTETSKKNRNANIIQIVEAFAAIAQILVMSVFRWRPCLCLLPDPKEWIATFRLLCRKTSSEVECTPIDAIQSTSRGTSVFIFFSQVVCVSVLVLVCMYYKTNRYFIRYIFGFVNGLNAGHLIGFL